MNIKGKKILVTGSEGFIGSHLVERLVKDGADVTAFILYNSFNSWGWLETLNDEMKSSIKIIAGDVRDEYFVENSIKNQEIVFHLAALIAIPYSYYSPTSYVDTNIKGTLNVLQACRKSEIEKLIHTSTSETYGSALYVPIDEKHPLQGQSPYSASKIGADMMAESFYRSFGVPVATVRPFNTYGPRQSARAIIPTIITQLLSGKGYIRLGDLTPTRDLNYVKDTVEGFIKICESEKTLGSVFNIGSGKEISIGDLAEKISKLMKIEAKIIVDENRIRPVNSEVNRLLSDNRKALDLAGWSPSYSLDEGLEETIEWMKMNISKYKSEVYNI